MKPWTSEADLFSASRASSRADPRSARGSSPVTSSSAWATRHSPGSTSSTSSPGKGGDSTWWSLTSTRARQPRWPSSCRPPGVWELPAEPPSLGNKPDATVTARDDSKPISRTARRSLGVSAEPITIGQRTGMKVVGVQPDSPAQKAGIEPGDVIVAANGVPVTGAEAMQRHPAQERRDRVLDRSRHAHGQGRTGERQARRRGSRHPHPGPRRRHPGRDRDGDSEPSPRRSSTTLTRRPR